MSFQPNTPQIQTSAPLPGICSARHVGIFVFDGVQLLDVTGPAEVFHAAGYALKLYSSDGNDVTSSAGVRLAVHGAADDAPVLDTLILAGSDTLPGSRLLLTSLQPALLTLAKDARRIASVCTGAFLLAEAGYLDGLKATTHWRFAPQLRRQYPRVAVEEDSIFIGSGRIFTSAGVTAGIDLALALVEDDQGAAAAREVARQLVVFMRREGGQSQFTSPGEVQRTADDDLRKIIDAVRANPTAGHSVTDLARRVGLSTRQLARKFHAEWGSPPAKVVGAVRLEVARQMLEAGHSVTSAAMRSGLGSDETLRRLFGAAYGVAPGAYQKRFRSTGNWTH